MTNKTTVLIVEDDLDTAAYLKKVLTEQIENVEVLGSTDRVNSTIDFVKKRNPEIILMDIILQDGDAFAVLDAFSKPSFEVIFTSAHGEYIEKALDYYALNFLTKPIDSKRLIWLFKKYNNSKERILEFNKYEMLKEIILEKGRKFLLQVGNKHVALEFSDIIRCKADGNYTHFILRDKRTFLVSKPLGYFCDLLERKHFFRTSRFDLVNLYHVDHIYKKETVVLSNNDKINVSNRNRTKLTALIKEISI